MGFFGSLKGPPEKLVKLIGGDIDISSFVGYIPMPEAVKVRVAKIYPKEILQRLLPDYQLFLDRGISKETLELFEAGLAHAGKLNRRICFPIYNRKGQINGFTGRWYAETPPKFGDKKIPKWKHNCKATEFIYPCHLNEAILREKRRVILVESVGDVIALWDAGIKETVCVFGTSMSTKVLNYLIGIDPLEIIIATNNDLAVEDTEKQEKKGPAAAKRINKKLAKLFSKDKIFISLPPKKDFGEMSKEEIRSWYGDGIWKL